MMIPQTLLVAGAAFDARLDAEQVAGAIVLGLNDGGRPAEACAIELDVNSRDGTDNAALLASLDFDRRMRAARAVVLAAASLQEQTLAGSITFEIATRARQAGVPAYAVTGEDLLDSFDARILDLQTILRGRTHRSLRNAGRRLAELV